MIGSAPMQPRMSGAWPVTAPAALSAAWLKVSGIGRVPMRENGHTITKARPITRSSGIVPPPGSPWCARESRDTERWSPITHSRPSGTVISKGRSEGWSPGYR